MARILRGANFDRGGAKLTLTRSHSRLTHICTNVVRLTILTQILARWLNEKFRLQKKKKNPNEKSSGSQLTPLLKSQTTSFIQIPTVLKSPEQPSYTIPNSEIAFEITPTCTVKNYYPSPFTKLPPPPLKTYA